MAQPADSVAQVVYLLGNTATAPLPAAHLQAFKQQLQRETQSFTILHLGDVLANQGLTAKLHPATTAKLDQLLALTKVNPQGKLYFIPGDKDWGNSGPEGLANVRRLEQYIRAQRNPAAALVPGNGCPGPAILDVGPHLRIIAINTQWWLHPYQKPAEPATDCNILSSQEFVETVQDAIEEATGRHILLVGHHPVVSNGVYGGHVPWQKHLFPLTDFKQSIRLPLPVLGSLYAAYRQNVGTPRDMAHPNYQQLITDLNRVLKVNDQLIYAAAHDYSLQLNARDQNYHLVAGSFAQKEFVSNNPTSLFNQAATGYAKITFFTDGKVTTTFYRFNPNTAPTATDITLFQSACAPDSTSKVPVNEHSGPCIEPDIPAPATVEDLTVDGNRATVAAGPRYAAPKFKRKFFGNLYRSSWTQPVRVPLLRLSRTSDKLRPLKAGGGRQTAALRLQAADGRQYVFRSVDKDPAGGLPPELRNTVATDVLREITPTEHPYGALIASRLLDATDILHARPKLYVLADDRALGPFRQNYKGLFGMSTLR